MNEESIKVLSPECAVSVADEYLNQFTKFSKKNKNLDQNLKIDKEILDEAFATSRKKIRCDKLYYISGASFLLSIIFTLCIYFFIHDPDECTKDHSLIVYGSFGVIVAFCSVIINHLVDKIYFKLWKMKHKICLSLLFSEIPIEYICKDMNDHVVNANLSEFFLSEKHNQSWIFNPINNPIWKTLIDSYTSIGRAMNFECSIPLPASFKTAHPICTIVKNCEIIDGHNYAKQYQYGIEICLITKHLKGDRDVSTGETIIES